MNENFFDSVDEKCRSKFETDWINGVATELADYLPPADDPMFLGTLHELVHIELEFRWKQSGEAGAPPRIEAWLERFPALIDAKILPGLIQAEFELRWQHASSARQRPEIGEYAERFRVIPDADLDVRGLLEPVLKRLATAQPRSRDDGLSAGAQLGRYRLVAEHGRGGFGAVWRADDTRLGRRIALKRLGANLAREAESRRRFMSEARVTARLEHPGIVPVYDMSNQDDDHAWYAMKLVRGETLAGKIDAAHVLPRGDSRRAIAEQHLLRSFLDVCHTIDYCHARGVVHRDIKPQNVVVGSFGETIVLDWGLACVDAEETSPVQQSWDDEQILSPQESIETMRGSITGTPAYMPPEQAGSEFHRIGRHSDIYSLGAMLYHMIVGQPAFGGGKTITALLDDVRAGNFPTPRSLDSSVPRALEAICLRAMQRDPRNRYENVEALSQDVQRFMADEPVSVYREPLPVRCRRWVRKNRTLATGITVAALFAVAASIVGAILYGNAQRAEAARVAEILDAAEQAENAGLLQLRENRFESAMQFFEQSAELVADEPDLAEVYQRVAPRAVRLRSVVEAYELAAVAQQALYHDQISKAAIYSQAAVQRLGILEHPDWWIHLPVDDMNPEQVEFLRQETYRLWGMWSTMRFAELTEEDFSFPWLMKLLLGTAETKSRQSLRSAMFAAQAAIRYRPSTMLRFILFMGNKVLKRDDDFQLPMKRAENASDAAMIGSILDTHADDNRLVMTAFMGREDPDAVADALLLDGIANIPQWYWLAVFVGKNQLDDAWGMPLEQDDDEQRQKIIDAYQQAIRTYSHAVGVNKHGWLAYSSRALAYTSLARIVTSEEQKNLFLKNAVLDIARAEAIAPNHPQFLRDKAYVLVNVSGVEEVARAYTHSVFNRPYLDEVRSRHFAAVLGKWIWPGIVDWEKRQKDVSQYTIESTRMAAAVHLWSGDLDKAIERIDEALEMDSDDVESRAIKALIELKTDNMNADARTDLQQAINDGADHWCTHYRLGQAWLAAANVDAASKAFEDSMVSAQMDWQQAWSDLALATVAVMQQDAAAAQAHFEAAIAADLSIDLTAFDEAVRRAGNLQLTGAIQQHADFIAPWFRPDQDQPVITRPALANAGFELELAHGWGESRRESPRIWEIKERFWTTAIRDTAYSHSGIASLRVDSDRSPDSDDEMSLMVQQIPVTPGQWYRVSVWVRAQGARSNTLGIYSDDRASQPIVSCPAGDYPWQQLTGVFTADSELLSLVIACRDEGTVWIDDIEIEASH